MIIHPYREDPERLTVAALLDERHAIDENGTVHDLERLPAGIRVFAPWDQVEEYARQGLGEMLCWGDRPIRWRYHRFGDAARRNSDVVVVKIAGPTGPPFLEGIAEWRDWLDSHGATVGWSLGGTSMSLLRAKLAGELVTTNGRLPAARWTLGGRQHCAVEPGATIAGAVHLDLPAAYSTTIGRLRYGGVWRELERPEWARLERLSRRGFAILVHGRVRLPRGLAFGPLAKRPRKKPDESIESLSPTVPFPVAGMMQGLWLYDELAAAVEYGARFTPDRAFVHVTVSGGDAYPFARWFDACLQGRELSGNWPRQLAKATANALWGQFVIDDDKRLEIHRWDGEHRQAKPVGRQRSSSEHPTRAWDLGEIVCGRVRASLYRMMENAGPRLVTAHTDGGWLACTPAEADEIAVAAGGSWSIKDTAAELQVLDQQKLRYRKPDDPKGRWRYTFSGVTARRAPRAFEQLWRTYARAAEGPR